MKRPQKLAVMLVPTPPYEICGLAAAHRLGIPRRFLIAFGSSAITHPFLWFVFPWESWPYLPTVILGEVFVVISEALFAKWLGVPRPWLWSLFANATSLCIGLLL